MSSVPQDDLIAARQSFSAALASGRRPLGAAEEFFEAAAVAVSRMRAPGPLGREDEALVEQAVGDLIACGDTLFAADPEAARPLGEILSYARHLGGALSPSPDREARFDELNRRWHWRTMG